MASNEMFVYGGDDFVDFLELLQDVAGAMRYGPAVLEATGKAKEMPRDQIPTRVMLSALSQHVDLIGVPSLVVGFKLKDADLAKEQLIKLEMLANMVFGMNPYTQGHFKKTKVGRPPIPDPRPQRRHDPLGSVAAGEDQESGGRGRRHPANHRPAEEVEVGARTGCSRRLPAGLDRPVGGLSGKTGHRRRG